MEVSVDVERVHQAHQLGHVGMYITYREEFWRVLHTHLIQVLSASV